jgi:hypothetical protein
MQRKPHHYSGMLIMVLALLSIFAWAVYPPPDQREPFRLVVMHSPVSPSSEPSDAPNHILRHAEHLPESGVPDK